MSVNQMKPVRRADVHSVCVAAQVAAERPLPQWLTGIIAVCGFLFLVFVSFLVNRAWCGGSSRFVNAN